MTSFRRKRLGDILVAKGVVTQAQITEILSKTNDRQKRIGEVLEAEGLITEEVLARALAEQRDLRYLDLTGFRIAPQLLEEVPPDLMHRYRFVPIEDTGDLLVVAVTDPTNIPAIDELEMVLKRPLEICVSAPSAIQSVLGQSESSERVLQEVSDEFKFHIVKETEDGEDVLTIESVGKDESPVIKLIHTTVLDALERRASDIHVRTTDRNVLIKYRIDGIMYAATEPIDIKFHSAIISRIKVMSDLDIAERRVPQDGRFKLRTAKKTIDFRVSILPSAFGEDVVIRILDRESITAGVSELKLDTLGFNESDLRRFRRSIREPYGMVLVTGPTGSGKTTTLYAAISEINNGEDTIITIEDPIEFLHRDVNSIINQREVGFDTEGFDVALKSALRQDPDVILVGEMRDYETIETAITAAETGHLVLSSIHAKAAVGVLSRLLDLYDGDIVKSLAAYNAGPERVDQYGGVPPFAGITVASGGFTASGSRM